MASNRKISDFHPRLPAVVWVLWIVGFQILLLWIYHVPEPKALLGDEVQYSLRAQSILQGGPWHPSFLWPPGQPLFLAALARLLHVPLLGVQIVQFGLLVGCAFLLRELWRRAGGSTAAATAAALLFLAHPSVQAYAHYLWPEVPHLFLTLLSLWLLVRFPGRLGAVAGSGAVLGCALLFKSLWTAAWPLWLLLVVLLPARRAAEEDAPGRRRPWRIAMRAVAFLAAMALVTAPAWWHGWQQTGRPMIADSSVFNLWTGLNDDAHSDYVRHRVDLAAYLASGETVAERHAAYWKKIHHLVSQRGWLRTVSEQAGTQYHRLFSAKTLLVTQLPGPRCRGHIPRYREPPGPWVALLTLSSHSMHIVTLVGFALGLALWQRWRRPLLWVLLVLVGYQLALFLGLHVKTRYVLPLWPVLCGFAGSAWARFVGRQPVPELRVTRSRLWLGAGLAVLLLWLAFSGPYLDGAC